MYLNIKNGLYRIDESVRYVVKQEDNNNCSIVIIYNDHSEISIFYPKRDGSFEAEQMRNEAFNFICENLKNL